MTVVVNAVSAKVGGGATYLRELVRELAGRALSHRFIFYVPPEQAGLAADLPTHIECRVTRAGQGGALRRLWWDQVSLRRILRRERADVLYSPADFAMFFCPVPQLLLAQNALYSSELYRERFLQGKPWRARLAFRLRTALARRSARAAALVTTPSQALAEQFRKSAFFSTTPPRVNPFGVRPNPAAHSRAPEAASGQPFRLLHVAYYYDYKNLGTLLLALRSLTGNTERPVELTTTADPLSPRVAAAAGPGDRLVAEHPEWFPHARFLDEQTPEQLTELYRSADALVHASVIESFGLPLLDALACGLPVVAADIPVNRELASDAAVYFHPFDSADLAEKIAQLASDTALQARLGAAGRERARMYTWSAHVDRLLALLEEIGGAS